MIRTALKNVLYIKWLKEYQPNKIKFIFLKSLPIESKNGVGWWEKILSTLVINLQKKQGMSSINNKQEKEIIQLNNGQNVKCIFYRKQWLKIHWNALSY